MKTESQPAFEVRLERLIDAPREQVFEAWSKPEQVRRWFAPAPYTLPDCEMDFRTGGRFRMSMLSPEGKKHWFSGVYGEIVPPERLSWTGEFPEGPAEQMRTLVTFEAKGKKTLVKVHQAFRVITPATEPSIKGSKMGWTMTLDQLAQACEEEGGS